MLIKILGSAAGGGFPQWNCACANCRGLRAGNFPAKARTQAQVAITQDRQSWFLLGSSPDLRVQIEATPEMHPRDGVRQSPISGAVLLNADIDHVLGLLLLRELQPLRIYSTASVRRIVRDDNSMFAMLNRMPNQAQWTDFVPREQFALRNAKGEDSGVLCRALSLGNHYPAYVAQNRESELVAGQSSLGLMVESPSGAKLAYMPAVPQMDDTLIKEIESADVVLFDGTFWSDDELIRIQGGEQTACQMGHIPISGNEGSLSKLAGLSHPRKIYLHINNTNPVLDEASPQHREVREAGWEIAEDGWQFEL